MAKRYKKAKTAKRAKAGKKTKAAKTSKAARKTKVAKKTKPVKKTKAVKKAKTAKKTRRKVQGIGNEICVGERERVDAARARVDSLFELLNNPETPDELKPQIQQDIQRAETDLDAAQRQLDQCIAGTLIP